MEHKMDKETVRRLLSDLTDDELVELVNLMYKAEIYEIGLGEPLMGVVCTLTQDQIREVAYEKYSFKEINFGF